MLSLLVATLFASSPVDTAEQRFRELRYADVLTELARVEHQALDEATFVRRLELAAISRAMLQKPDAADAFRPLLWLRPSWTLPPEFGPRVRTPFLQARAWRAALSEASPAPVVTATQLTLAADPLKLVASIEVEWTQGGQTHRDRTAASPTFPAPWRRAEDVTVVVRLFDADGSVLLQTEATTLTLAPAPVAAVTPLTEPPPVTATRSLTAPLLVTVGALALVGGGTGLHVHAGLNDGRLETAQRNQAGDITSLTQVEAQRLDEQLRTERLVGTSLLIAGAAATATAVVLWVHALNAEVRVTPTSTTLIVPLDATFAPVRAQR